MTDQAGSRRIGRRALLGTAAGTAIVAAGGLAAYQKFHNEGSGGSGGGDKVNGKASTSMQTRIELTPPIIDVKVPAKSGVAPGYVFFAPKHAVQDGLAIADNDGQYVWANTYVPEVTDFRVQTYKGEPVMTYWQGQPGWKHGLGEYAIVDRNYRQIASVRAGSGFNGDLHEFQLTDHDTALITVFHERQTDLSAVGGSPNGWIWEGVAQEIDIATGKLLFEWHSLDHVPVTDGYYPIIWDGETYGTRKLPFDYFHINSVHKNAAGDYLISSRTTHTVYKVDGKTGKIIWQLGGKHSDFSFGPGASFKWQHCVRFQGTNRISIFDNHMTGHSRGILLDLDEKSHRATLRQEYVSPEKILAPYQANMEILGNGNVFIGWGDSPYFTEFAADGSVLYHAGWRGGGNSYRAYRCEWHAQPVDKPIVIAEYGGNDTITAYVSWNGATEVASWRLETGDTATALTRSHQGRRAGFETSFTLPTAKYIRALALDSSGTVIGTSEINPVYSG